MKTTYHFDPDAMRARFQQLRADRDRISADDVDPLRKQMDAIIAEIQSLEAKLKPIDAEYREKRQTLVPIDKELAIISRALKGETAPVKEA